MCRLYKQISIIERRIDLLKSYGEDTKEQEDFLGYLYYKVGQYYSRKFYKTLKIKRI
jgi:hypothetical protein